MPENRWAVALLDPAVRALGSLTRGAAVVPNDAADLAFVPRAVHIGTGGTMSVVINGVQIDSTYEAGWHWMAPTRIRATLTAALQITIWD